MRKQSQKAKNLSQVYQPPPRLGSLPTQGPRGRWGGDPGKEQFLPSCTVCSRYGELMKQNLPGEVRMAPLRRWKTQHPHKASGRGAWGLLTYCKGRWFFLVCLAHQGVQKPGSGQPVNVALPGGSLARSRAFQGPGQASAMGGCYTPCW